VDHHRLRDLIAIRSDDDPLGDPDLHDSLPHTNDQRQAGEKS
jgi:hypothetical protein